MCVLITDVLREKVKFSRLKIDVFIVLISR